MWTAHSPSYSVVCLQVLETGGAADAVACGNTFTLAGKGGADTFTIVKRTGGADIITDFKPADSDLLALEGFASLKTAAQVLLNARQAGADTKLTLEGTHTILLKGVAPSDLGASSFAGALGARPLLINSMDDMWFQSKSSVAYDLATMPAFRAKTATQGELKFKVGTSPPLWRVQPLHFHPLRCLSCVCTKAHAVILRLGRGFFFCAALCCCLTCDFGTVLRPRRRTSPRALRCGRRSPSTSPTQSRCGGPPLSPTTSPPRRVIARAIAIVQGHPHPHPQAEQTRTCPSCAPKAWCPSRPSPSAWLRAKNWG